MGSQVHVYPPGRPHGHTHRWRRLSRTRRLTLFFGLLLFVVSVALVIFNALAIIQGAWFGNVSIIFSALGAMAATLAWLFPVDPSITGPPMQNVGRCPDIDPDLIVRCEGSVQEVYEELRDLNISAIVLRGLNGAGAPTLANLVFRYAEEQRKNGSGPFIDKALWFYIGANTTVADFAEELSRDLGKALPDLSQIASERQQAEQLFEYLKSLKMRRLIVLDFKNPLEQSSETLTGRPGFKEFIRILNSHSYSFRVLLTSRPWSSETKDQVPLNFIQEHHVRGLDEDEGIELLQRYRIEGTDHELRSVVRRCDGHAGALVTLASTLDEESMDLAAFLENNAYIETWMQEVSEHYLDHVCQGLSLIEKELLFAYSVYRKPIGREGVKRVMRGNFSEEQLLQAFRKLNRRDLFLYPGEGNNHQLHALVATYARGHFGDTSDPTKLQEAHRKAALYYEEIMDNLPSLGPRRRRIELIIERAWHLHKAGQDQNACSLIEQEQLLRHIL